AGCPLSRSTSHLQKMWQVHELSLETRKAVSISQSRLIEQNVPGGQRPRQGQTLQRAAPRQSDIGLSVGECSPAEVDVDVVQGQPLSFVNGESPGETYG